MIAPHREWWWKEVLYQGEDSPETKEEVIERISKKEQIIEDSATIIVNGARSEGIIQFANDGYPQYNGVELDDPSEEPEYIHTARKLNKDGIAKLRNSNLLHISVPTLLQRASSDKNATLLSQTLPDNQIRADDLTEYIQEMSGVEKNRARAVFENNDSFEVNDNVVEYLVITDDMEIYDIIEPNYHPRRV